MQAVVPDLHLVFVSSSLKNLLKFFAYSKLALAWAGETGIVSVGNGSLDRIAVTSGTMRLVSVLVISGSDAEAVSLVLVASIDVVGAPWLDVVVGRMENDGIVAVFIAVGKVDVMFVETGASEGVIV